MDDRVLAEAQSRQGIGGDDDKLKKAAVSFNQESTSAISL